MEALFLPSNKQQMSDSFALELNERRSTSVDISRQTSRNAKLISSDNFLDSLSKGTTSHDSRDDSLAFSSSDEPLLSSNKNKANQSTLARGCSLILRASPFHRRHPKKTNKNNIEVTPVRCQYQAVTEEKLHAVQVATPSDTASSSDISSNEPSVSSTLESTSLLVRKQSLTKKDVVLVEWIKRSDQDDDKLHSSDDTQEEPLLSCSPINSKSCFCIPRKRKQKGLSMTGSSFRSFKSSPEQPKYCAYHEEPEPVHSHDEYNAMGTFEDFNIIEPVHWNPVFMEGTKISDLQKQTTFDDDDDDDEYEEEAQDELDNLIGSLDGGIEIMGTPLDSQLSTLYEVDDEERTRSTSTTHRTMDRTVSRSQRLLGCLIGDGSMKSLLHDEDSTKEHPEERAYQFTTEGKPSPRSENAEATTEEESDVQYSTDSKIRSNTPNSFANTGSTASTSRISSQSDTMDGGSSETCGIASPPPMADHTPVVEQESIDMDELSDFYSLSTSESDGGEIWTSNAQQTLSDITEEEALLPGRQSPQDTEKRMSKKAESCRPHTQKKSIGTKTITPTKNELQRGFQKYREIQDNKNEDYADYNNLMYYAGLEQEAQLHRAYKHTQRRSTKERNIVMGEGSRARMESSHTMRIERVAI